MDQSNNCIITLQEENSSEHEKQQDPRMNLNLPIDPLSTNLSWDQLQLNAALMQMLNQQMNPQMNLELLHQQMLSQELLYNTLLFQQQLQTSSDQKIRKTHIKKTQNSKFSTGHWKSSEHQAYLSFVQQHCEVMMSPELKKTNKIFKLMSDIIQTRSPSQCRSHHQKFNPKSKYIQNNSIVRRRMKEESKPESQQQKSESIDIEVKPEVKYEQ